VSSLVMRSMVLAFFCLLCCSAARPERRRPKLVLVKRRNDTIIQNNTPENPCKATALDFVFVIDSSRSIRPEDYDKVKTFIINLLQFLDVGLNSTRVGLLQYGSVVQPEFSLNTHTSKAQVEEAVRNMQHLATGTMTGLAIQYTMEVAFTEEQGARPKSLQIPRIAMIVTDGRPQDTVEEIAAEAREAGIQIFAIGVGRVEMKTLKAIGSQPHSEHVHLVANFSQIETLISVFKSKLCGGSDMCKVVEHQCQHICVSSPASYRCRCRKGFTLNPDGKTCKAEDMCAAADHGCDHICVNLADGYECRCRPGYELTIDLKTCNRIDYCDLGNHGCEHNCVSLPGSYICSCKKGFVLNADGKTCSQIDHCAAGSHGCEQEFMNTETSCVCKCTNGYTLRSDGKTCQKVDPCADGSHGCEQEFVSAGDSCVCRCRKGFTLRPDGKTCKKVDPCADGSHGCEQEFVSAGDSCVCRCRKGFTLRPDGKTCKKIEHCLDGNDGCEQEFINTENSCVCKCREGYTLRKDGKTCQTVVEITLSLGVTIYSKAECKLFEKHYDIRHCYRKPLAVQVVYSLPFACGILASSVVTFAQTGFKPGSPGGRLQSVDLCQTLDHGCQHLCFSTTDSYICKCNEGFLLAEDGKSCEKPGCHDGVMDLVFVIDGSKSLGPANFELVKQFVNSIVDSLNVSRMVTRVGLIQFSTKVRTEFSLGQHAAAQDVKRAVNQMQYMGRGSMTGSALRHMFQFSFSEKEGARLNVPRVCIVFTDGRSQDDVSEWASKAKTAGVTMYALGVGKAIEQELREIASEPAEMHLYYAEDFEKMGEITKKLKSRMCKVLIKSNGYTGRLFHFFVKISPIIFNILKILSTGNYSIKTRFYFFLKSYFNRNQKYFVRTKTSYTSADKPADESLCRCESVIVFQNQVTEKLKNLAQRILEAMSKKLETLENQVVNK
uniref:Matrilin 2 n=1 Tax=Poecilia formosa TaxID=48698 RepID=A0A087Y492_POEFO